ncbi:MAG: hypothetical protein ACYDES_03250 [Acidimicrobiales bacterium]
MFVLSHWWMAETAELVTLTLVDLTNRDGNVLERCQIRLARPTALVATKLQSIDARRGATAAKRESDAYDVYRLLRAGRLHEIAEELGGAPADLGTWCVSYLDGLFVDRSDQTARWLRNVSPAEVVDAGDLSAIGSPMVEEFQRLR